MRRILAALIAIVAILATVPAAAATLTTNGSGQLTGATGVTVGGSTYTVTFVDGTCAGVFSGCDAVSDFTFQTQADAQAAGLALLAQVIAGSSFDASPGTTFGCIGGDSCFMLTPFGFTGSGSFNALATQNGPAFNTNVVFINGLPTVYDNTANNTQVWAVFTPTAGVPEPATWAIMLLGFAAIGLAMRRRRAPLAA